MGTPESERKAMGQRGRELTDVLHRDAQELLGLGEGMPASDPQLALAVEPELAVLPVGTGQQIDRRPVPGRVARALRLQDQDAVLGLLAGEIGVLRGGAEGVLGVVRTGLQVARGNDQPLAGEARGQRGAAGRGVPGLSDRLQTVQLGVGPAGLHVVGELIGKGRVQSVLPLLDRLCFFGFRGFRGELL